MVMGFAVSVGRASTCTVPDATQLDASDVSCNIVSVGNVASNASFSRVVGNLFASTTGFLAS